MTTSGNGRHIDDDLVRQSYEHCRGVTRREARNFYYGLKLAPEPRRSALFAIYAWMRRVDDEADSDAIVEAKRDALERVREQTERALAGDPPLHADPLWPAFAHAVATYPIDRAWLDAVFEGMLWDLEGTRCETRTDLDLYCYRVASTVGMICVSVWGLEDGADRGEALELAIVRGRAFQLTNVLRDFVEDYDRHPRRVYLPGESFRAAGLKPHELRVWYEPRACEAFLAGWAREASSLYEQSAGLDGMVARDCRGVLATMTRIYRGLLDVIERDPARVIRGPRVSVPAVVKARIALSASLGRSGA
ncbi:MAG: phytoene/squalene synthase family protein [Planctomycetota bacterium]